MTTTPFALGALAAIALPAALVAQPPAAPATGDAKHGGQLFLQCRACHVVAPGAAATIGPNLYGIVGAKAGSRPGYAYSTAMVQAGAKGTNWTPATLDTFLTRPSAMVPGTKMAFAGISDPKNRADVIAYLTTLKAR